MFADGAVLAVVGVDGVVYSEGRSPPVRTGGGPARFLAARRPGRLLVAGHVSQRRLIAAGADAGWQVWAAGAGALGVDDPVETPEAAVYRMLGPVGPPSVGGWHPVTSAHVGLLAADPLAVAAHPVVRLMSFVYALDSAWLGRVMSCVVDPRWYVDPDRPDSPRRFRSRLGLFPQRRVSKVSIAVKHCWLRGLATKPAVLAEVPGAFPHRAYLGTLGARGDHNRAVLRGSLAFAGFLRSVWLGYLSAGPGDVFAAYRTLKDWEGPHYRLHAARALAAAAVDGGRAAG